MTSGYNFPEVGWAAVGLQEMCASRRTNVKVTRATIVLIIAAEFLFGIKSRTGRVFGVSWNSFLVEGFLPLYTDQAELSLRQHSLQKASLAILNSSKQKHNH
jgi:hypothetical protein